jgi:UPF0755 protein
LKKIAIIAILCVLLGLAGAGIGLAVYVANALKPTEPGDPVRLVIPPGISSGEIASLLESQGLIRDAQVFRYYLRYIGEGSRFQAGEYLVTPGTELNQLIDMLNRGLTIPVETIRFTIPEGFTVLQIAERLDGIPGFDKAEFMELIRSPAEWSRFEALGSIPDDPNLRYALEGYLFPETYELKKGSTTRDIVERMLAELERKLRTLPPDWKQKLEQTGLSFHQLMTVASLIEREVVLDEERNIVAGVIYNRLKTGMKLQIDATVQYALDKPKERLFEKDLQVDSPYNTYRIDGLPPGPIASPSLKSILAALEPAETAYFYYVTKKDGTQGHYFGVTHEDHLRNIRRSNEEVKAP